jgi:CelD/BcsL family acetyltransferase involved in cellulose biosynthesis
MSAPAARILRRPEELDAIAPAWWALWRRASGATPFQSPAWIIPWWRHFAPGELFVVAVARGDRLVGLAPLYVEDGALGRRLLPLGISVSDYHDILLDPDDVTAAGAALVAAAFAAGGWDLWDLEELMPNAAALDLPAPAGAGEHISDHSPCPTLALQGDDLMATLPRRMQRTLRLARNRAARAGPLAFQRAGPDGIADALASLERLHAARWQGRGEAGVLADARVRRFHREAAPALAVAGLLRLFTLRFGEEVVAASYGFHHAHRSYLYVTGFDPAHAFESPGVLMTAHAIDAAIRDGAREFHFLRGQEPYKYLWGAVDRWNRRRSLVRTCARDSAA